jgi:hypothetical protein
MRRRGDAATRALKRIVGRGEKARLAVLSLWLPLRQGELRGAHAHSAESRALR